MTAEDLISELVNLLELRDTVYLNGHLFGCPRAMTGADCYCGWEDDYLPRKKAAVAAAKKYRKGAKK